LQTFARGRQSRDEDHSYFITRLPVHKAATKAEVQDEVQDEVHDEVHDPLTDIERKLLSACSKAPQSAAELLHSLGYSSRIGSFRKALNHLLAIGSLELTVRDKPRSKHQKYRLTEKGRTRLVDRAT
jgi:ATP-dependent DNA helicase RecG